jgi:hypothetical protein
VPALWETYRVILELLHKKVEKAHHKTEKAFKFCPTTRETSSSGACATCSRQQLAYFNKQDGLQLARANRLNREWDPRPWSCTSTRGLCSSRWLPL